MRSIKSLFDVKQKHLMHCNICETETNHRVKKFIEEVVEEDEESTQLFTIVECQGCDELSYATVYYAQLGEDDQEEANEEEGLSEEDGVFFDQYPDPVEYSLDVFFLSGEERDFLPRQIGSLYDEVARAFEEESNLLTGLGLRTMIEAICINMKIPGTTLEKKINNLFTKGHISEKQRVILHNLRKVGNFSAHRLHWPAQGTIDNGLEIINHTLRAVYCVPKYSKKIRIPNSSKS